MKKLISILGALSLMGSGIATSVVACSTSSITPSPKHININNSEQNIKASSLMEFKQIILADKYGYDLSFISNSLSNKSFLEESKNQGLKIENKDNITNQTNLEDAISQYYSSSIKINNVGSNINLNGDKGTGADVLAHFLPKVIFGISSKQMSSFISLILDFVSRLGVNGIINVIDYLNVDNIVSEYINKIKTLIPLIQVLANALFTNDNFLKELTSNVDSLNVITKYGELKTSDLNTLAFLNIFDSVNGLLDSSYDFKALVVNENNLNLTTKNVGEHFGKLITSNNKKSFSVDSKLISSLSNGPASKIIPPQINRYISIFAGFIRALQLIQYNFSLYDDQKWENPKNQGSSGSNHTFDPYKKENEENKISSLVDNSDKNTVNLKYFLTIIDRYFGDLATKGDGLKQFITILNNGIKDNPSYQADKLEKNAITNQYNNGKSYYYVNGSNNKTVTNIENMSGLEIMSSSIIMGVISNKNDKFSKILTDENLLKGTADPITLAINTFLKSLIDNKRLLDPLINTILLTTQIISTTYPDNDDPFWKKIKETASTISKIFSSNKNIIIAIINTLVPNLNQPFFDLLYSGDIANTFNKLVEIIDNPFISSLIPENIKKEVISVFKKIIQILKNIIPTNVNKKQQLNIQNLVKTPINLLSKDKIDPIYGSFYTKMSISDLIKYISDKNNIKKTDTFKNLTDAYGFKTDSLKTLINQIFHYSYDWKNATIENAQKQSSPKLMTTNGTKSAKTDSDSNAKNLISIILENPNKFLQIVGLKDKNGKPFKTPASGSFADTLFNSLLPHKDQEDSLKWISKLLHDLIADLNKIPNFIGALTKEFESYNDFKITSNNQPIRNKNGLITDWSITVEYKEDKYQFIIKRNMDTNTFYIDYVIKNDLK